MTKLKMTKTLLILCVLASAGCIIHAEGADHHPGDDSPYPTQTPTYQAAWVEVSCYATGAQSSSVGLPGSIDFSEVRALGAPDTQDWNQPYCVDSPFAWSPEWENGGFEYLDLVYDAELLVDRVRIYENLGAGATDVITLANSLGSSSDNLEYSVPFELQGPDQPCSVLSIDIDDPVTGSEFTALLYDTVMLDIDTALVDGYNEIDAVELVGLFDDNSGPLPASCDYL